MFSHPTIEALLCDLHAVSGLRVSLHDAEFHELAAYPEEDSAFCQLLHGNAKARLRCQFTDRDAFERARHTGKIYVNTCCFGLWKAICPLCRNGVPIGYLMMEQGKEDGGETAREILALSLPYASDSVTLTEGLTKLPSLSRETVSALSRLMLLCAERAVSLADVSAPATDLTESVIRYINRNIGQKLTVARLCEAFHCSKSTLMNLFRKKCGMTLGEYLVDRRMAIAKELLQYSEEPVGVIALKCGFPDQGYFSKVFSVRIGCSPTAYRQDPFRKG